MQEVRRLLAAHGIAPHKRRGQHFVVDPNTVRAMVRRAGVGPGDLVAEIGPGLGALTLALVEAGARVVAVEVDAGLVRALEEVLADVDNVELVHADALAVDWPRLLDGRRARLVANLPYNLATPLLLAVLRTQVFDSVEVMVQREVGQRWAASVGDVGYSGASVKVALHASAVIDARVSRQAFWPVPGVDSVTVRVHPRAWAEQEVTREEVAALVDEGFGQRRKRLRNALAGRTREPGRIEEALTVAGLAPTARAEELDVASWVALARALRQPGAR